MANRRAPLSLSASGAADGRALQRCGSGRCKRTSARAACRTSSLLSMPTRSPWVDCTHTATIMARRRSTCSRRHQSLLSLTCRPGPSAARPQALPRRRRRQRRRCRPRCRRRRRLHGRRQRARRGLTCATYRARPSNLRGLQSAASILIAVGAHNAPSKPLPLHWAAGPPHPLLVPRRARACPTAGPTPTSSGLANAYTTQAARAVLSAARRRPLRRRVPRRHRPCRCHRPRHPLHHPRRPRRRRHRRTPDRRRRPHRPHQSSARGCRRRRPSRHLPLLSPMQHSMSDKL